MQEKYLGKNLKFLRKRFDKTQYDVASYVNKRSTAISSWENNLSNPSLDDVFKLSVFFGVIPHELLFIDLSNDPLFKNYTEEKKEKFENLNANLSANLIHDFNADRDFNTENSLSLVNVFELDHQDADNIRMFLNSKKNLFQLPILRLSGL